MNIAELFYEERLNDGMEHMRLVTDFSCGTNDNLDKFLKSEAFEFNRNGEGNTYLLREFESCELIGYYTLKANNIPFYKEEGNTVKSLPAIELARFAINYELQSNGYGKLIFATKIISKINDTKELIGVNTVMLFAVSDNEGRAIKFYKDLGFKLGEIEVQKYVKDDYNEGCKIMYMSTNKMKEFEQEFEKNMKND